jgi:hypothetical protein
MKKEATSSLRAGNIGALTTLETFVYTEQKKELYCLHPVTCHVVEKKVDGSTPGVTGTLYDEEP